MKKVLLLVAMATFVISFASCTKEAPMKIDQDVPAENPEQEPDESAYFKCTFLLD